MKFLVSRNLIYVVLLSTVHLNAQVPAEKEWTPEVSFSLPRITETCISPNAAYVAYVVRRAEMTCNKSEFISQIHVAAVDGSFDRPFTFGDKSNYSPKFSSDGNLLAFLSNRTGNAQVFILDMSGGEARQLTFAPNSVSSFKWSPDNTRIAYLMTDPETETEKERKSSRNDIEIAGKNLKYRHIYVTGVFNGPEDKPVVQQITSGEMYVNEFDWSPDGKTIVFSHQPDPDINTTFIHSDISLVPSDSGTVTRLVDWPGVDNNPLFSPNGKRIAFTSQGGKAEPLGLQDLYTIPINGGKPERITYTPDRNASLISWAPDGKSIYFSELTGTSSHLYAARVKGDEMAVVTLNNRPRMSDDPSGTPEGSNGTWGKFSVAGNRWAFSFTWQSADHPEEVYYSDLINFNPKKISSLNGKYDLPPVARTKLIRWDSGDNHEIEGLLTYPTGYEEGRQYPLILLIHGGPAGGFSQYFTGTPTLYLIQDMAREGYAVLRANPRGSTGYGKDFRYSTAKDWGYGDYDDLMAGVNEVIQMGVADKNLLFVAGWSYGGYLTSFIITRTDRFRAASMGAGLPDLVSMTTTTDIPDYLIAHMGGELWENYDTYMKHSAIYHLNNIKTPLQILHGENDQRVPSFQGKELYVALKRKGVPTEFVLYPRSGHTPSEPKLMMDVTPRILSWFKSFSGEIVPAGKSE